MQQILGGTALKKILLILILVLFIYTPNAWAHTQLISSQPEEGEGVTDELEEIVLTFGEHVEEGSTFELIDPSGESILTNDDITISENEVIGTLPEDLESGEYEVDWYTISADGHPIEGAFTFTIETGQEAAMNDNNENERASEKNMNDGSNDSEEGNNTAEENQVMEDEPVENVSGEETAGNDTTFIIPLIIAGLILIILSVFLWLRKRDK